MVRHKKRQIQTIAQWMQAFTIFTAALVSAHPSATLELLAYSLTIIKASQQYDGLLWRSYDVNYRVAAAASGNRKWSRLDTDLFTRFFTGRARLFNPCSVCDSVSHGAADCPKAASRTASKREFPRTGGSATPPFKKRRPFHKTWASDICADYNAKGACAFGERCKFRHVCADCGGGHCAKSCPTKS